MTYTAYILLGSNLGDRSGNLELARNELGMLGGVSLTAVSSVYESAAKEMGRLAPHFLNQAAKVESLLSARDLLEGLELIEHDLGRTDKGNYESRTIDLDLLYFGNVIMRSKRLTLPHPRVLKRAFALVPLLELAPSLIDPSRKRPVASYLIEADALEVRPYNRDVARAV